MSGIVQILYYLKHLKYIKLLFDDLRAFFVWLTGTPRVRNRTPLREKIESAQEEIFISGATLHTLSKEKLDNLILSKLALNIKIKILTTDLDDGHDGNKINSLQCRLYKIGNEQEFQEQKVASFENLIKIIESYKGMKGAKGHNNLEIRLIPFVLPHALVIVDKKTIYIENYLFNDGRPYIPQFVSTRSDALFSAYLEQEDHLYKSSYAVCEKKLKEKIERFRQPSEDRALIYSECDDTDKKYVEISGQKP